MISSCCAPDGQPVYVRIHPKTEPERQKVRVYRETDSWVGNAARTRIEQTWVWYCDYAPHTDYHYAIGRACCWADALAGAQRHAFVDHGVWL